MEHVLYVFATVQVKTAHFSLHLLTMLTPHQAFSISETQSVPKICQQMPVCQILKQKEQISMECTNGKNRVFPFVLFFCIALGIRVLKSICTHINTAYIHTYVRIYIYIMHRQLLSCDVGIDRFLLSSLIQPWGCTGFMGIPGQAVDVPQLSLGRSHGR